MKHTVEKFAIVVGLWWILILGIVTVSPSFAGDDTKILILNSDASVTKYQVPQKEFQEHISYPVETVNLGQKKWDPSDVEDLIYDEEPGLIYCIGSKAFLLAQKYAGNTPLVFSSIINWLRFPLNEKTFGVSNELHAGMEMMLFRYIFPELQTIGILYSKKYTGEWFKSVKEQAEDVEFSIIGYDVSNKKIVPTLEKLLPVIDALWLIPDPELIANKEVLLKILKGCDKQQIPVLSYHEAFAKYGAVLTVAVDNPTIGRQAAGIANELLAGDLPGEKVQYPAGSYIILNLQKVSEYDLPYNEEALGSVNAIIE